MNQDFRNLSQFKFSGLGCWLTAFVVCWLLGSVGLGWLVNSFFILLALILVAPVIGWFGFRWWVQRNLVEGPCPVCSYEFTGFNGSDCRCPSCGEPLKVESGRFNRITPPGTIDVDAVEVSAQPVDD